MPSSQNYTGDLTCVTPKYGTKKKKREQQEDFNKACIRTTALMPISQNYTRD